MNITEYLEIDDCWVGVADSEFYVGIKPSVVTELGEITFVDQIPMGKVLSKGGVVGIIESSNKGDWPFKSPVTGQVNKFNTKLNRKPNLVCDDPKGEGWIVRITIPGITSLAELSETE